MAHIGIGKAHPSTAANRNAGVIPEARIAVMHRPPNVIVIGMNIVRKARQSHFPAMESEVIVKGRRIGCRRRDNPISGCRFSPSFRERAPSIS